MTVFQTVEAYVVPYGLVCSSCGAHMHIENRGVSTRARCLSRHCENYGWMGELPNERVKLITAREEAPSGDAPVIDVTPEKAGGND